MPESLFSKSYSFAMDLDDKVREDRGVGLEQKEFDNITTVLQYPKTHTGQKKFFTVLNALSTEALIERVVAVSSLVKALQCIERNRKR